MPSPFDQHCTGTTTWPRCTSKSLLGLHKTLRRLTLDVEATSAFEVSFGKHFSFDYLATAV